MEKPSEKASITGISALFNRSFPLKRKHVYGIAGSILLLIAFLAGGIFMHSAYASDTNTTSADYAKAQAAACKPRGGANDFVAAGRITAINRASLTIQDIQNIKDSSKSYTVKTTGSTSFASKIAGRAITLNELKVSDFVSVGGTRNSDGTITANAVVVGYPSSDTNADKAKSKDARGIGIMGQITAINGSTLTIRDLKDNGKTYTIKTSASTRFVSKVAGKAITLSDLKVGNFVGTDGSLNSDGSISGDSVVVVPQPSQASPKC